MLTPVDYEHYVAEHFQQLGYDTEVTGQTNDYGLDILAENAHERLAIQAKFYGHTSRHVNRQMIMELHGVKDYFDCTRAVLVTNGVVRQDAQMVASKLKIDVLHLDVDTDHASALPILTESGPSVDTAPVSFESIWAEHIMPLTGTTITSEGGRSNAILTVDWAGIERISSNGRKSSIDIEIFRLAINRLLTKGSITRDEINQNYAKRASSAVTLVLSQVPFFRLDRLPKMQLTYIPMA